MTNVTFGCNGSQPGTTQSQLRRKSHRLLVRCRNTHDGRRVIVGATPINWDSEHVLSQVVSHILHGHVSGKFQDVTLESPRVSPVRICKGDSCLSNYSTDQAKQSLNETLDQGWSQTYRECHPHASDRVLLLHCLTPTMGALECRGLLIDSEHCTTLLKSRVHVMDSPSHNPKTVIKYTRGHDFLAFPDFSQTKECRKSCPHFVCNAGTHLREEPK
jgi:hypothetical protein